MRLSLRISCFCFCLLFGYQLVFSSNRIEGQIYDENRNPIGEMYVELQTDAGSTLFTQRANASGRFTFINLHAGTYRIRVLPSGKNFLEQSKDVQFIPSMSGRSEETQFVEFYMHVDKRATQTTPLGSPEVIFAQEVPDAAKKLYESGAARLDKGDKSGVGDLQAAIAAFPTYFAALARLGQEYVQQKDYENAYPLFLRAIDVNQKSYATYYGLAFSFYSLNQIPAAIKAAEACTVIKPEATDGHTLLGMVLRIHGDLKEAEKELRKGLSLSKGQSASAHWQLALLLNRMNRNPEAADEVAAYLKIPPHDAAETQAAEELIAKLRAARSPK